VVFFTLYNATFIIMCGGTFGLENLSVTDEILLVVGTEMQYFISQSFHFL
jgi:hypothetical protein